jgi:allantoinase
VTRPAHELPFAPIHDRLPYSPFVDRRPIRWPGGERVAVWVVPNVEHYEYLPPPSVEDPYPRTPHPDVRKYSYNDYANRVGFWRLLEVFDRHDVACTVSLNVGVLDHFPEVAAEMLRRGWDWMSHGTYNTRYVTGMSEDEERDLYAVCNRVLERHTGSRFKGMLGPFITGTPRSPDLMAEAGMTYHADWVHDDRPSPLITRSGRPFVAMPYSFLHNDGPLFRGPYEGADFADRCIRAFDRLHAESERGGRTMCIALHPFIVGHAHRVGHIDRIFAHLRDRGAWIARASDIVDHYLANHYEEDAAQAARLRPGGEGGP